MILSAIFDETPTFGTSPWPFIALMLAGFVIGTFGHITKIKGLVAFGIGLLFLGTFILPLIVTVMKSNS